MKQLRVTQDKTTLWNGELSATFLKDSAGWYPEWFREKDRLMLRFKDHEWTSISCERAKRGELYEQKDNSLIFRGIVDLAGVPVDWIVSISISRDGPGFDIESTLIAKQDVEMLEAFSAFETPYEYDGSEESMTIISQQPVYWFKGDTELSGAGYYNPTVYYCRRGTAYLTAPSRSPLMVHHVKCADGSNERFTMFMGDWSRCDFHELIAHPTRKDQGAGLRGYKYLVGCGNWTNALVCDPNFLFSADKPRSQRVAIDFTSHLPSPHLEVWLISGWERLVARNIPADGRIKSYQIARSKGVSWRIASRWLIDVFQRDTYPEIFNSRKGVNIYLPGTRPKDEGRSKLMVGQWLGPLAFIAKVYNDVSLIQRVRELQNLVADDITESLAGSIGTLSAAMGITPAMQAMSITGAEKKLTTAIRNYTENRLRFCKDGVSSDYRGDYGIVAYDADLFLLGAEIFGEPRYAEEANILLARVNAALDERFWNFNCSREGDLVGCGQARALGYGAAIRANLRQYQRTEDKQFLHLAERFGNLLLAMNYSNFDDSVVDDLDMRGWSYGSTGGRDQNFPMPPFETCNPLHALVSLMHAGRTRPAYYDVLWLIAHTGLAMFPTARTHKRMHYRPGEILYRPVESIATEMAIYNKYPYLAYENPYEQTLLAPYQGVEPLMNTMIFGGGLVEADDDRVLALALQPGAYDTSVTDHMIVHLWNPTANPISATLECKLCIPWQRTYNYKVGNMKGIVSPKTPKTQVIEVPMRQVVKMRFMPDQQR